MRLLVEVVIIGALISLGWNTPFKVWGDRATTTIQTFLPKRPSGPGVLVIPSPIAKQQPGLIRGRTGERKLSSVR
jgi:hypothetical protein